MRACEWRRAGQHSWAAAPAWVLWPNSPASNSHQLFIQSQVHIPGSPAKVQVVLLLVQFLGEEGQEVEEKAEPELAVFDGNAEVTEAFQILAHTR